MRSIRDLIRDTVRKNSLIYSIDLILETVEKIRRENACNSKVILRDLEEANLQNKVFDKSLLEQGYSNFKRVSNSRFFDCLCDILLDKTND